MFSMIKPRSLRVAIALSAAIVGVAGCGPAHSPTSSAEGSPPQVGEGGLSFAPLPPDPAFATAARASCLVEMGVDPAIPLVVHDQRRPDLAALRFEGPGEYLVQIVERRGEEYVCTDGGGGTLPIISGVALAITDWQLIGDGNSEGWLISGHVDSSATEVRIRRAGGTELRASVANGRFVAFWIGPQQIAEMAAFDAAGREIARVDDPIELGGGIP